VGRLSRRRSSARNVSPYIIASATRITAGTQSTGGHVTCSIAAIVAAKKADGKPNGASSADHNADF
jgi:hypothetical protein